MVPSTAREGLDPWVFVVNEAEAYGKPVIVTDAVGAHMDLIREGFNGFVIPAESPAQLAIAMQKVLHDYETIDRMGRASLNIIMEEFGDQEMFNGFKKMIEGLEK